MEKKYINLNELRVLVEKMPKLEEEARRQNVIEKNIAFISKSADYAANSSKVRFFEDTDTRAAMAISEFWLKYQDILEKVEISKYLTPTFVTLVMEGELQNMSRLKGTHLLSNSVKGAEGGLINSIESDEIIFKNDINAVSFEEELEYKDLINAFIKYLDKNVKSERFKTYLKYCISNGSSKGYIKSTGIKLSKPDMTALKKIVKEFAIFYGIENTEFKNII